MDNRIANFAGTGVVIRSEASSSTALALSKAVARAEAAGREAKP
jgi:hypothetical protein